MALRRITAEDLTTLRWIDILPFELERVDWTETATAGGTGWWRIVAEITCSACGAVQAVDSDPTNDKQVATALALTLFDGAGWRADEHNRAVCPDCEPKYRDP